MRQARIYQMVGSVMGEQAKVGFMARISGSVLKTRKRAVCAALCVCLMMPTPSYAMFDGSAIVLQAIYMYIKGVFMQKLQDLAEKQTNKLIKDAADRYAEKLELAFMPSLFCDDDLKQQEAIIKANREERRSHTKTVQTALYGAGSGKQTYDKSGRPVGNPASFPGIVAAATNEKVAHFAASANCKPVAGLPADKGAKACTAEEANMRAELVVGPDVAPPLTEAQTKSEAGALYTAMSNRQQLIRMTVADAIADVDSPTRQAMLNNFRTLTSKPSIEELAEQSASGGVERDMVVLTQIQNQVLLETLVERLEQKRLLAMEVSLATDALDQRLQTLRARVR